MRRSIPKAIFSFILTTSFMSLPYLGIAQTTINFGGTGVTISHYPSGSDGKDQGDIVLYENVATVNGNSVDCYIVVDSTTKKLSQFDEDKTSGSGWSNNQERFLSPKVNFPNGGGIILLSFQFIQDGTFSYNSSTGAVSATNITIDSVVVNTYDTDGNGGAGSYQQVEYGGFETSELDKTTNLDIIDGSVPGLSRWKSRYATNTTNVLEPKNRVRVFYDTMSYFQLSVGAQQNGHAYFFIDFSDGPTFSNTDVYYRITGNVLNDTNGVYGDSIVNGTGINTIGNNSLYANLINSGDSVMHSNKVLSDGSYQFGAVLDGTYTIIITDSELTKHTTGNSPSLPAQWVFSGEKLGTGSGYDSTTDGELSVTVNGAVVKNANFGINKRPESVSIINGIISPSHGDTLSVGKVTLIIGGFGLSPSGSDFEEGTINSPSTIQITSLPIGSNQLVYDGTRIMYGDDNTQAPSTSNPFTITNFDLDKLKFVANDSDVIHFNYALVDQAGFEDETPASFTYFWTSPLPVEFIGVAAELLNDDVLVTWSTASELNNEYFEIQRRYDYEDAFTTIGTLDGSGTTNQRQNYQFLDENNRWLSPVLYYRIKQVDFDGKYDFSNVVVVSKEAEMELLMYPNPAQSETTVAVFGERDITLTVIDMQGKDITNEININESESIFTLDVNGLRNGMYLIQLTSKYNQITERLTITR